MSGAPDMATSTLARRLDGVRVGAEIRAEVAAAVRALSGRPPGLAVVLAGNDPASEVYVRSKIKACAELGFFSEQVLAPAGISTPELVDIVANLNARPEIDGLLVQLPLPAQVDEAAVLAAVSPEKDVDGFHPVNVGRLAMGRPGPAPCTPAGVMELLRRSGVEVAGREAVVVGRSQIVGRPMAALLVNAHATVTLCHSRTRDLAEVCRRGEILVAAIGRPAFLGAEHIRPGAVVVDVGVNRLDSAELVERYFPGDEQRREEFARRGRTLIGDVDPRAGWTQAGAFTPVPGGVGPLTIAMLMSNTLALRRQHD